jgi:hypothetical protein
MSSSRAFSPQRRRYLRNLALRRRSTQQRSDGNIQAILGGNFRRLPGGSWSPSRDAEKKS